MRALTPLLVLGLVLGLALPALAGQCDDCQMSFVGDVCPGCDTDYGSAPEPEGPPPPSAPFSCEGCGRGFSDSYSYASHLGSCVEFKKLKEAEEEPPGSSSAPFSCEGCGQGFSDSYSYASHLGSCAEFKKLKAEEGEEGAENDGEVVGGAPDPAPVGPAAPSPAPQGEKTGPRTAKANGGYPVSVPTNRCKKCGQRYPTKQSDAEKYGVLSYYPHVARCDGNGDGQSGPPPQAGSDGGDGTAPTIDFGGVPVDGAPVDGGEPSGSNGGGDGGGAVPGASGNETVAADGADGTVQWALEVGPKTKNPRVPDVAPPNCWDNWCLKFVAYAWIFGGKKNVPQIAGATARESMDAFISAGLMRKVEGSIPKGAPVYWDHGEVGHIAISMGENDGNGEPLIITTWVGGTTRGIFVKPISWINAYVGTPKGWGVVK